MWGENNYEAPLLLKPQMRDLDLIACREVAEILKRKKTIPNYVTSSDARQSAFEIAHLADAPIAFLTEL